MITPEELDYIRTAAIGDMLGDPGALDEMGSAATIFRLCRELERMDREADWLIRERIRSRGGMEMSRTRDRITVGKAHAFDMGYTADELKTAWDTVKKTNVLVQHLENNGVTPLSLPPDLMDDLMKKYKKIREESCPKN